MEYNLSELKKKSVINVKTGKKLGKICDVELCFPCLKVKCFILSCGLNLFSNEKTVITPLEIQTIGEDAILVNLRPENANLCKEQFEE